MKLLCPTGAFLVALATLAHAGPLPLRLRAQEVALSTVVVEADSANLAAVVDFMAQTAHALRRIAERSRIGQEEAARAELLWGLALSYAGDLDSASVVLDRVEKQVAKAEPVELPDGARTLGELVDEHRERVAGLLPVKIVPVLHTPLSQVTIQPADSAISDVRLRRVLRRATRQVVGSDTTTLRLPGGKKLRLAGPGIRTEIFDPVSQPVLLISSDAPVSVVVKPSLVDPRHDLVLTNLETARTEPADSLRSEVVYSISLTSQEPAKRGYTLRSDRVVFLTPEEVAHRSYPQNVQICQVDPEGKAMLSLERKGFIRKCLAILGLAAVGALLVW